MRTKAIVLALVAALLIAGLAQSAPSRVDIKARAPQAQQPDTSSADDDPGRSGTQVNPRAGESRGFPADVIVYDDNGHNDIRAVNVTVLRADNVTVHNAPVVASKLSGSGTRGTFRATVTMDSDDPPGTYILRAAVLDRDAAVTYAWTNFTYEPLAALTLATQNVSIAKAGSAGFRPGSDNADSPVVVNVTNGGNVNVSLTVSGTALSNATWGASVPASNMRASRLADMSSSVALGSSAQSLAGAAVAPNATAPLHFVLAVPEGLRPGDYTGELTIGAVSTL